MQVESWQRDIYTAVLFSSISVTNLVVNGSCLEYFAPHYAYLFPKPKPKTPQSKSKWKHKCVNINSGNIGMMEILLYFACLQT